MIKVLFVCVLFTISGCSSKAVYDNIQRDNRQQCMDVPPPQYEECLERSSKPYEEYERDREAL